MFQKSFLKRAGALSKKTPQETRKISTPARYKRWAQELRDKIVKNQAEVDRLQTEIADLKERLASVQKWAEEEAPGRDRTRPEQPDRLADDGLHTSSEHLTVKDQMLNPQAIQRRNIAISRARSSGDALTLAAQKRGWSLRDLAEKLGVSAGSLINWRNGSTTIPRKHADRIERELGLPASKATWPRGVRD